MRQRRRRLRFCLSPAAAAAGAKQKKERSCFSTPSSMPLLALNKEGGAILVFSTIAITIAFGAKKRWSDFAHATAADALRDEQKRRRNFASFRSCYCCRRKGSNFPCFCLRHQKNRVILLRSPLSLPPILLRSAVFAAAAKQKERFCFLLTHQKLQEERRDSVSYHCCCLSKGEGMISLLSIVAVAPGKKQKKEQFCFSHWRQVQRP